MSDQAPPTGLRTLPDVARERYRRQRHASAYRFAAGRCSGRRALDAGCGDGYGSRLLADRATHVVGVDADAAAVARARRRYPPIDYRHADLTHLPLADGGVDVAVCVHVLEQTADPEGVLDELRRVLAPGGELVCATSNRLTSTPGRDRPVDPSHLREFTPGELHALLAGRFRLEALLGVHHARWLHPLERLAGRTVPDLMVSPADERWPTLLQLAVAGVGAELTVRADRLDASLDLVAVASVEPTP
ncbi:MAG: class I SAM-dependent methyltransferase [Actinobacteria bacterium]|nr:class I SAM-dependent methyltransferase [Actinomycetota bacterium]